jgi:hypothetical protein
MREGAVAQTLCGGAGLAGAPARWIFHLPDLGLMAQRGREFLLQDDAATHLPRRLPPGGLAAVNDARWRDIVTSDGEFDVYRFQMLIFSLVVGISLLAIGLNELASFDVPANLLGVLGLSQIVYVGGKLVAPPSCAELDKAISDLRDLEAKFKAQAANANKGPPQSLAAAIALAPTEYTAFKNAVVSAKDMAGEVPKYGRQPGAPPPDLEPDYA